MSVSKLTLILLAFLGLHVSLTSCAERATTANSYCILPQDGDDPNDERWCDYLYDHLKKRLSSSHSIAKNRTEEGAYKVVVDYDAQMGTAYEVKKTKDGVILRGRDKEKITWLIYQFIASLGMSDDGISVADLPPSQIDLTKDAASDFAFEYRGLYTPHCNDGDMLGIYGVHNVDFDWAVWGHNLSKILSDKSAVDLYAHTGSADAGEQFCFTSEALYKQIERYIIENVGDGSKGSSRFAILPNDNDIVCLCGNCVKEGNTAHNASPAVASLVARLARRFPKHMFFMSAYRTTRTVPPYAMAQNVGVLVSSIEFPMKSPKEDDSHVKAFTKTIGEWKKTVKHIYVWDYMRNYDDYLTPFPCLGILQKRLQFYKRLGINGIFFNGSGYDYASFDGLHTYALAALTKNPDTDVKWLVDTYFKYTFPKSHETLSDYYLGLEEKAASSKEELQLYGGMEDSERTFFNASDFVKFYESLPSLISDAGEEEAAKLTKLQTALSFTRLEIARASGGDIKTSDIQQWTDQLSHHEEYDDMNNYREAKGSLAEYLQQWRERESKEVTANRLKGRRLTVQGETGFTAEQVSHLTDGQLGFTTDYHTQWLITKVREWGVDLPTDIDLNGTLELSFLVAPIWHIYAPLTVNVYVDGNLSQSVPVPEATGESEFQRATCSLYLEGISRGRHVRVTFVHADGEGLKTACDEVMLK